MNKKKIIAVIFWIFAAAVMIMIYCFSSDNGEESAELSENLLSIIIAYIGQFVSHNLLRKIAHFCEFAALGFFTAGGFHFTLRNAKFYYPLMVSALYAVSDEIHQFFVPGRACRVLDVFIDSCGALCGIAVFLLLNGILYKIIQKRKKS